MDRPILMSAPMVRSILREVDPKTQTRRLMSERHRWHFIEASGDFALCPYGQPGDRLWVREKWTWQGGMMDGSSSAPDVYKHLYVKYEADGEKRTINPGGFVKTPEQPPQRDGEVYSLRDAPDDFLYDGENTYMDRLSRWWQRKIPGIHMYRWASRITLEITEVRVQRLQEISEADARAEGLIELVPRANRAEGLTPAALCLAAAATVDAMPRSSRRGFLAGALAATLGFAASPSRPWEVVPQRWTRAPTAQQVYAVLWESLNGPGSWDANPWVWAISFKRTTP